MSQAEAWEFLAEAISDPALQAQIKRLIPDPAAAVADITTVDLPTLEQVVRIGREQNYDFTAAELRSMYLTFQGSELPDEALDLVAGGAAGGCYIATATLTGGGSAADLQ